ncbi:MAG TPA: hypothetical protein VGG29_03595 [Caulobacteraceae bacterium]|jgi:hypothetical protein
MGWSADQVDRASLWQFICAWRGWRRANCVESGPRAPSADEHERNVARAMQIGVM